MQNDLALILLALFIPWEQLHVVFARFNCNELTYKERCAEIWDSIKLSLPAHLQQVARNIELLRKYKADAQVDAALRTNARRSALSDIIPDFYSDDSDDDDDDDHHED